MAFQLGELALGGVSALRFCLGVGRDQGAVVGEEAQPRGKNTRVRMLRDAEPDAERVAVEASVFVGRQWCVALPIVVPPAELGAERIIDEVVRDTEPLVDRLLFARES